VIPKRFLPPSKTGAWMRIHVMRPEYSRVHGWTRPPRRDRRQQRTERMRVFRAMEARYIHSQPPIWLETTKQSRLNVS